jgi:hypothetical protein
VVESARGTGCAGRARRAREGRIRSRGDARKELGWREAVLGAAASGGPSTPSSSSSSNSNSGRSASTISPAYLPIRASSLYLAFWFFIVSDPGSTPDRLYQLDAPAPRLGHLRGHPARRQRTRRRLLYRRHIVKTHSSPAHFNVAVPMTSPTMAGMVYTHSASNRWAGTRCRGYI